MYLIFVELALIKILKCEYNDSVSQTKYKT